MVIDHQLNLKQNKKKNVIVEKKGYTFYIVDFFFLYDNDDTDTV